MAHTKVQLDIGKTKKAMGEVILSMCKTSGNRKKIDSLLYATGQRLENEFEAHPVTQEIASGPSVDNNPSNTLGGYGGLFSFIGFEEKSQPLAPIRRILAERRFKVRPANGVLKRGNVVTIAIEGPTALEIFEVTPMPWAEGRSWAKGIEGGIKGLGYYLNTEYPRPKGWSGQGLQTEKKIDRNGTAAGSEFTRTKYISSMIAKYSKEAIDSLTSGELNLS